MSEFEKEIESINELDYLAVSEQRKQKIRQATLEGGVHPKATVLIQNGWYESETRMVTKLYYNIRMNFQ